MNFVASMAQVSLWFFLFVALLLKVQVNGDATDSRLFNAIIVVLTSVPVVLPVVAKIGSTLSFEEGELDSETAETGKAGMEEGGG